MVLLYPVFSNIIYTIYVHAQGVSLVKSCPMKRMASEWILFLFFGFVSSDHKPYFDAPSELHPLLVSQQKLAMHRQTIKCWITNVKFCALLCFCLLCQCAVLVPLCVCCETLYLKGFSSCYQPIFISVVCDFTGFYCPNKSLDDCIKSIEFYCFFRV